MDKRVSVKTIYLLSVISIGLIGLALGSTFAMFEASSTINNPISLSSTLTYSDDVLQTINVSLDPEEEKEITLNITNSTASTMYYSTWYLNEGQDIDFATDDDTTGTIAGVTTETLTITIRNNTSRTINVTIGVSTSNENNIVLATNMVLIPVQAMPFKVTNLVTYISNLYSSAPKSTVTNNSINYNITDDTGLSATEKLSLMNDRLGGTTQSLDDGNIRYYGANPNNYVYFNCSDYDNQDDTSCELWRIIGVFDTTNSNGITKKMVKIIRNDSIGSYSWDTSSDNINDGRGINEWSQADLMKLLNQGYENNAGFDSNNNPLLDNDSNPIKVNNSLYWNSGSGYCYNNQSNAYIACDFTSTGIKNNTTRNMITEVTWNLGAFSSAGYVNVIYANERDTTHITNPADGVTREYEWTGKIALMYTSDYGYATDLSKCSSQVYNYSYYNTETDSYDCRINDWLFMDSAASGGTYQTTLSPYLKHVAAKFGVSYDGSVATPYVNAYNVVRPTLYLDADTMVVDGDGTSTNPYQLG